MIEWDFANMLQRSRPFRLIVSLAVFSYGECRLVLTYCIERLGFRLFSHKGSLCIKSLQRFGHFVVGENGNAVFDEPEFG